MAYLCDLIPFGIETIKRAVPIDSSTFIGSISRLHGEPVNIPDVSFIRENDEKSCSSIDSITCSDIDYSPGFEISENSDEQISDKDIDEYGELNFFEDTGFNETINSAPHSRKHKDEIGNRFEDEDHYNSRDSFGEAQNSKIHIPKEKGKPYRNVASLRKKHTDERGNSFEDFNQCYAEDRFENAQNIQDELQKNEFENSQTETAKYQRKGNEKVGLDIIQRKLTNSSHRIRNEQDEGRRSFEDKRNSFQESQNIQTDISKRKNTPYRSAVLKTKRDFNTSKKAVKSLNISKNFTDHSRLTNIKHESKRNAEVRNSFEDKDSYSSGDNFEVPHTIQTETPKIKGKFYRGVGSARRKHTDEKGSSFEDINQHYTEDRFENIQNIPDEELQMNEFENSETETGKYQRKGNGKVGHDIIQRKLTNSHRQIRNEEDEGGRSFEDADEDKRKSFQEAQNIQIDIPKRKETLYGRVALKTKRCFTSSKKVVKSRSISKNSAEQDFVADGRNNQNQEEKRNWPLCCLTTFNKRTFSILQPVIRHDIPIDSITLMSLEENKKKCKHSAYLVKASESKNAL
ncbi:hypothetical protein HNY73_010215 [Argiope bruennichi]|uniref:Uncharacterized protein n=1 Tax=Argiope bruennichi TaxID=94029 RepID=A0A8T0F694_ARGBR|nr:hypothetical protein HNY73_010215 [Argiope bruennichi]